MQPTPPAPADVFEGRAVSKVLRSAKRRALAALDLSFLDEWMDNGPGRNPRYDRSQMLRGLLLCTAETKFQYREMADYFGSVLGRLVCDFADESPVASTIWEFWHRVQPFIHDIFDQLVELLAACGLYGTRFSFDSTYLPCSRDDPDGVWMWIASTEEWVYGYGLLVAVDCASGLPAGAVVTQRKQHPETATLACYERLSENTTVTEILGDSAYDTLEFHDRCLADGTLPICRYNPRNTADPPDVTFRIELLVQEYDVSLDEDDLTDAFDGRIAVERFFSTLKEDEQILQFRSHGRDRVETHVGLVLIDRLITVLSNWIQDPTVNLGKAKPW